MSARSRELAGLIVAALLAGIALASVTIVRDAEVSASAVTWGALFLALYLAAHVVVRRTTPYADGALLPLAAVLTAFGIAMIYRLDGEDGGRQAVWVAVGVGVLCTTLVALRHDYRVLESYRYLFGVAAVALLLLPSVPGLGERVNGVRLWVSVGPLQFQPGELAKICLILFLAGYLREKREAVAQGRLKDFGPLVAIWGAAMLVIVQTNDLGSALLNFGIFLAMLYAATGRALFVAAGLALFVGGATVLYNAIDHVQSRVTIWLHPWTDEKVYCALNGELELRQDCASYQLVKSLYSIANGGFGGTGLG
ncbi:MAG TPA: FtsW/RodA/SpoVE family cell cycle protein, partial [Gaiellaceae bacterium]|nr:FtsW/RodA/SpoVE family cell cycle protein [Gaiellaceae bacterium]